jgi:hypothetical protein
MSRDARRADLLIEGGSNKYREGGSDIEAGRILKTEGGFDLGLSFFIYCIQIMLLYVVVLKEGNVYSTVYSIKWFAYVPCLSTIRTEYLNPNAVYLWFKMYERFFVITISGIG